MTQDHNIASGAKTDVLIVGSGPTGLMAALLLQHCGVKVQILDKSEQQAHESRALALQSRSLELFQNLGIIDKFMERGVITPGLRMFVNSHQAAEMNLNDAGENDSPYAFILMLSQAEIENILVSELEKHGVQVEHNTEVTAFVQNDQGVTITAVSKEGQTKEIHASYLLGADGAHSIVRDILALKFEGGAYPQNFMLADCILDWQLDYSFVKIFMRGTSLGIFFPIKGTALSRIVAITPHSKYADDAAEKTATTAGSVELAEVERAFQDAVGLPLKCSRPVWTARYRIHHRATNKYAEGRVFVAGDAAHIHSPVAGQGMNTGLQDVANLAWKLALSIKGHGSTQLLESYNTERWPVGQKLLHFTDALFSKVSSQNSLSAALRNFFLPLMMKVITRFKSCKSKMFYFISQLGIRYHENAFLLDDIPKKARRHFPRDLSPGHRAPDAIFKRAEDIFSLINGYQFHLLVLARKALSKEEIDQINADLAQLPANIGLPLRTHVIAHSLIGENKKIIQAESNQVFDKYGLSDQNPFGVFVIRPDGYIAYRADQLKVENLKRFFGLFLGNKLQKLVSSNLNQHQDTII